MSMGAAIWLEPGDDLYDAPMSDPRMRQMLAENGIDPAHVEVTKDADGWKWFSAHSAPTVEGGITTLEAGE